MSSAPSFYDSINAGDFSYRPNIGSMVDAARSYRFDRNVSPSAADAFTVELLAIDLQKEFCHHQGSLYCAGRSGTGAIDDSRRIAELIYRNIGDITAIRPTLDTHVPIQIFFPTFWVTASDEPVAPHTTITLADIRDGVVKPSMAAYSISGGNNLWVDQYVRHYCEKLEEAGRYSLYIWPMHCLIGTDGHNLQGVLAEAFFFHGMVRQTQCEPIIKGTSPWTENYSAFEPEVTVSHDGRRLGKVNEAEIVRLFSRDAIVVVGQASSHCVRSSLDSLLAYCERVDPSLTSKVYVVRDCMSAVTVHDGEKFLVDYTDEAEAALAEYAERGMHVVESTTDMRDWPGMRFSR